jgi:hypothetical protein
MNFYTFLTLFSEENALLSWKWKFIFCNQCVCLVSILSKYLYFCLAHDLQIIINTQVFMMKKKDFVPFVFISTAKMMINE